MVDVEENRLKALRTRVSVVKGRREEVRRSLAEARDSVRTLTDEIDLLDLVAELLRTLVDAELTDGVRELESLQTEGVRAVFKDQNLKVRADVEVARGKVNVSLITMQQRGNDPADINEGESLDGFGGAVATVQSVLLRLSLIFRRGLRPILIFDETLPAFDDKYVYNAAEFLKVLCKRLGVDILLVTHNQALVESADRAYKIRPGKDSLGNDMATFHRLR